MRRRRQATILGLSTLLGLAALGALAPPRPAARADDARREEAIAAMQKALAFFRGEVAQHGGYVYYCTEDLSRRWGEGEADADTIFVQPPATPTVGLAYLAAFEATDDRAFLDAARDAAGALVRGQLESGGWTQKIHLGDTSGIRRVGRYRKGGGGKMNNSSFDDGQTAAALRLLARTDRALGFEDESIHEAARYAVDAVLNAQLPNGAFPQVFTGPAPKKPVAKASFPDYDWRTENRIKEYWNLPTLNDGAAGSICEALITAEEVYEDARCRAAIERLGDFLVRAQMPDPQPAWAQQYTHEMRPAWARKFEPPAISGWESQDVMITLLRIARHTGNERYLEPVPRALAYLKRSMLPDGQLARFYELRTNRPLYMTKRYELTHDDSDVPGHYGFKVSSRLDRIERWYDACARGDAPDEDFIRTIRKADGVDLPRKKQLAREAHRAIAALDARGRWISVVKKGERMTGQPKLAPGTKLISSAVFATNLETIARWVAATR